MGWRRCMSRVLTTIAWIRGWAQVNRKKKDHKGDHNRLPCDIAPVSLFRGVYRGKGFAKGLSAWYFLPCMRRRILADRPIINTIIIDIIKGNAIYSKNVDRVAQ